MALRKLILIITGSSRERERGIAAAKAERICRALREDFPCAEWYFAGDPRLTGKPSDGKCPAGKLSSGESSSRKPSTGVFSFGAISDTLFLCDSMEGIRRARENGGYAAGFHYGLAADGISGTPDDLRKEARITGEEAEQNGEDAGQECREEIFPGVPYVVEDPAEVWKEEFTRIYAREAGIPWTAGETKRIRLRELMPSEETLRRLREITVGSASPDIPDFRTFTAETLRNYCRSMYDLREYGMWGIELRETGSLIGLCGFNTPSADAPEAPTLGYVLDSRFRGQGYAREAGMLALDLAFRVFCFDRVRAETDAENVPSVRLLTRLGFTEIIPEVPRRRIFQMMRSDFPQTDRNTRP